MRESVLWRQRRREGGHLGQSHTLLCSRANNGRGNCLIVRFDDLPRWISRESHISLGFPSKRLKPYVRFGEVRSQPVIGCQGRKVHRRV